eukprot:5952106-Amphidinium_carterae.1
MELVTTMKTKSLNTLYLALYHSNTKDCISNLTKSKLHHTSIFRFYCFRSKQSGLQSDLSPFATYVEMLKEVTRRS